MNFATLVSKRVIPSLKTCNRNWTNCIIYFSIKFVTLPAIWNVYILFAIGNLFAISTTQILRGKMLLNAFVSPLCGWSLFLLFFLKTYTYVDAFIYYNTTIQYNSKRVLFCMQTLMYTLPMLLTSRHQLLVRFKKEIKKKIIK